MPSYHEYDYNNNIYNLTESRSSSSYISSIYNNNNNNNNNRNKIIWSMDRIRHIYKDHQLWPNFIGTKKIIFNEGDILINNTYLSYFL